MEDIGHKIDIGQFGGKKGLGTEHMMVCLVDRILKLLDSTTDTSAVIAAMIDWSNAFDRQDPTIGIKKFIQLGVRSSLIPLLISYLQDRKMKVKYNGVLSREHSLIGGGPQGTLLGLIEYLVQSNDAADFVNEEDRYKYIDDLTILELIALSGALIEFDCHQTVPSDVGLDQLYLPPDKCDTQKNLDAISAWTDRNLMKVNESKTKYMIFTRAQADFVTRLSMNNSMVEKMEEMKVVGVWLTSDMKWDKNTRELAKKAYSRMSILTKLKYVGVSIEDLLDVYVLFIRSIVEYCSVVWHSRLTIELTNVLERVQKICLRVILGANYVGYEAALEMCALETLNERRENRCMDFARRCLKHPIHQRLFPVNSGPSTSRSSERYKVNFAKTSTYKNSAAKKTQQQVTH